MSQRDSSLSPERKAKPVPPTLDPLQRYSVAEANALLRQSNARTYQQIKAGDVLMRRLSRIVAAARPVEGGCAPLAAPDPQAVAAAAQAFAERARIRSSSLAA